MLATLVPLASGSVLASHWTVTERFDPTSGSWAQLAPPPSFLSFGCVAALPGNRVLRTGNGGLTTLIYDPVTDAWTTAGDLQQTHSEPACVALADGRVLLAAEGPKAELFDPNTNTWSLAPNPNASHYTDQAIRLADGRVLFTNVPELFDPVTNVFTLIGGAAPWRYGSAAAQLPDGRVLIVGGYSTNASVPVLFDPVTQTYATAAALNVPRSFPSAVTLPDGRVVVAGGTATDNTQSIADVEIYDAATNTWTLAAPMLVPRQAHRLIALQDGSVLAAFGHNQVGTVYSQWGGPNGAEILALSCAPATCGSLGKDCGAVSDGCGGTLDCGVCGAGQTCTSSNVCCAPSTCAAQGMNCGSTPDGCGGTLSCGTCASPAVCSPSNSCCTPTTCAAEGKNCGQLADGCGGQLDCGACSTGTCSANVCVCQALTCAAAGASCGTISDGCGGTLSCGTCTTGTTCNASHACVDGTAPTVTVTSPGSGSTLTSAAVTITASASDNVAVTEVQFYDGATLLALRTSSPWAVTLSLSEGSHVLTARAFDAAGNFTTSSPVNVTVELSGVATFDMLMRAPRCSSQGPSCDSAALLVGRGNVGPESNSPNTLNTSCADGAGGSFHVDESLDRLKVSTLDGTPMAPGKTVRIEATVWAYAGFSSDKLDLYTSSVSGNTPWAFLGTLTPTSAGLNVLTTTFVLPSGAIQAIRGRFRYGGSATACSATTYTDHDDLLFAVEPNAPNPFTLSVTLQSPGATISGGVTLAAQPVSSIGVARVEFYGNDLPIGTASSAPWSLPWSTTYWADGPVSLVAKVFDTAGNQAESAVVSTVISNLQTNAVWDAALRVPRCATVGASCDSQALLTGRGALGPESNAPNTIPMANCADSSTGTFHADESLDRLKVSTVSGGVFTAGAQVRIDATVWAYSSADKLDLYLTTSTQTPSWVFLATLTPASSGAQVLTTTTALPAGTTFVLRGHFRYGGAASTCSVATYDDTDDLVFAAQ